MNRLEAAAAIIDGTEAALSSSTDWSSVTVNTVRGNDQRESPLVLVDDRQKHKRKLIGQRSDDGHVVDDQGDIVGERQRLMREATPEIHTIHSHETDSYRLQDIIYDWFVLAEKYPERLGPMVNAVRADEPYTKDIDYRSADDVFVQAVPIYLRYEDTVTDDSVEPIEEFYNDYQNNS